MKLAKAPNTIMNLEIQKKKTNPCPKYQIKVITIIQYIHVLVNVWKYLWIGLWSSYRSFKIPVITKANAAIIPNAIFS
jgi:uncharacterized membrane protein YkgB